MSGNLIDKHHNKNQPIGEYYFEWDGKQILAVIYQRVFIFSLFFKRRKTTGNL